MSKQKEEPGPRSSLFFIKMVFETYQTSLTFAKKIM